MGKQSGGFYAVKNGRCPGIYLSWAECESQVKGFSNARYKKFCTEKEALLFVEGSPNKNDHKILSQFREIEDTSDSLGITSVTTNSLLQPSASSRISLKRSRLNIPVQGKKLKLQDSVVDEDAESSKSVLIYTDGACCFNGREEAKAAIGVYWGPDHPLNVSERLPGRQTNNRAEIHAAVRALQQAKEIGAVNVTIYTDSNFLVKAITKWIFTWKKNSWKLSTGGKVKNKDDFEALEKAKKGLKVNWVHVRGHQGIYGNEQADRLAVAALEKPL